MTPRFRLCFGSKFYSPILPITLAFLVSLGCVSWAQTPVLTWHYDNARTGANTTETRLTPSNVNAKSFGKLLTQPVDGYIVGHALYLPSVSIPGLGNRSVAYVATLHDTVYAFDVNAANAPALWTTSLLAYSAPGATPVPIAVKGCASTVQWTETGVISTPVIDPGTGTIFLVAETYESGRVVHRVHGLDVTTGKEQPGWPVTMGAAVTQNGINSTFQDTHQMNRPGLLLNNGHLYVAFGGSSCNGADHGWVMSYNTGTAQLEGAFHVEPGQSLASIWQKGAGISADADGNVYATTGEGPVLPGTNFGSSVLKLSQSGTSLTLADWFTPWNWQTLNVQDLDLNNAVVMLPDQSGTHPHEAVTMGKEGTIYVLDRDNMGHFCSECSGSDTQPAQEIQGVATQGFTPVVWNGSVYISGSHKLQIYSLKDGLLTAGASIVLGTMTHPMITASDNRNGIVWLINGPALTALDALTLTKLYTSNQAADGRDTLPPYAHFASPIAADGKVFVGTQNSLVVYGLLPALSVVAGNQQSGTVATRLPTVLRVRAKDASSGKAVPGVPVTFSDGGNGGTFGTPTGVTNSTGAVSTTYKLPTKSGVYTVTASAAGYGPGSFSETALAAAPAALLSLGGRGQTAVEGTMLPAPLVVKVRDTYGNGVPGISVSFTDHSAGGTFSATPVTTDSGGQASVTYTAGPNAGTVLIVASAPGAAPITFSETIIPPPASPTASTR